MKALQAPLLLQRGTLKPPRILWTRCWRVAHPPWCHLLTQKRKHPLLPLLRIEKEEAENERQSPSRKQQKSAVIEHAPIEVVPVDHDDVQEEKREDSGATEVTTLALLLSSVPLSEEGSSLTNPSTQEKIFEVLRHFNFTVPKTKSLEEAVAFSCYYILMVSDIDCQILMLSVYFLYYDHYL